MGYLNIGAKTAMGIGAGIGIGYAGHKIDGFGTAGLGSMGVGAAVAAGSTVLGARGMGKHATTRALARVTREATKVADRNIRKGNFLKSTGKLSAMIGVGGAAYGGYQYSQGDIGGTALGGTLAAAGLYTGGRRYFGGRRLIKAGSDLIADTGNVARALKEGGRLSKGAQIGMAQQGKRTARAVASGPVRSSGAAVNPASARAVSQPAIGPETRGQRAGNAIFKAIGSTIGGGFFS